MNFFYGLLGIILSFLIVKYRKEILKVIGRLEWAERYLGNSGTLIVLLASALFIFFVSFLFVFGQQGFLLNGFEPYAGGS